MEEGMEEGEGRGGERRGATVKCTVVIYIYFRLWGVYSYHLNRGPGAFSR